MRRESTQLGAIGLSMILLVVAGIAYAQETMEDCERMEAFKEHVEEGFRDCAANGNCEALEEAYDELVCHIEDCWNTDGGYCPAISLQPLDG